MRIVSYIMMAQPACCCGADQGTTLTVLTQGGGLESSGSYPMLNITELEESIMHVLLVLSGGVW